MEVSSRVFQVNDENAWHGNLWKKMQKCKLQTLMSHKL